MKTLKFLGLAIFLFGVWSYYTLSLNHPSHASFMYVMGYYMPAAIPFLLGGFLYLGIRNVEKEMKEESDKDE